MMTSDTLAAVPVGERQLFLDDAGIARLERLTRTAHQPAKKARSSARTWMMWARVHPNPDRAGVGPHGARLQALDDHYPRGAGGAGHPLRRLLRERRRPPLVEAGRRADRVPRFAAEQLHHHAHQQGVSCPHARRL